MNRALVIAFAFLCLAAPAVAQLTVATDEAVYIVGDVVEITIHNGGPSVATFVGSPLYSIVHVESGVYAYGETLVPDITFFQVGQTAVFTFATAAYPHEPGHYRVYLNVLGSDPGSILETTYTLEEPVSTEATTWSRLKALSS